LFENHQLPVSLSRGQIEEQHSGVLAALEAQQRFVADDSTPAPLLN
jgi:hypothetical protein